MQLQARTRTKSKAHVPWWSQPGYFFFVPFTLFCAIFLWSYVQLQQQLPSRFDALSPQERAAIRCNPTARPVATCAHRGNAAELLASRGGGTQQAASVLQQMQLLWEAGVTCFDMDVVQLRDNAFIVGHPADLAARVNAAALPTDTNDSSNDSSSSSKQSARAITADQLYTFSLQELRAAGLTEAAAPSLRSLLAQFRELLDSAAANSSSAGSAGSDGPARTVAGDGAVGTNSVQAAAAARSWVSSPLISLEPKGLAATDAAAFEGVAALLTAAGLDAHAVLWMRQMPPTTAAARDSGKGSGSSSGGGGGGGGNRGSDAGSSVIVTDLARTIVASLSGSSSSRGDGGVRPLLGLIVTDMLLQQKHLAALKDDTAKLVPAVLATAGGVDSCSSSNGGSSSSSSSLSTEECAAKVLQSFNVLAPSIKLPAGVLEAFLAAKPCLAWTLEGEAHARKAMWLGLDVAITNEPMAQLAVIKQEGGSLCKTSQG